MVPRLLPALLILALAVAASADSFAINTTLSWTNKTNASADSFVVGNASTITGANLNTDFSRWGHIPIERQGFLWAANADWDAGTHNNSTTTQGSLSLGAGSFYPNQSYTGTNSTNLGITIEGPQWAKWALTTHPVMGATGVITTAASGDRYFASSSMTENVSGDYLMRFDMRADLQTLDASNDYLHGIGLASGNFSSISGAGGCTSTNWCDADTAIFVTTNSPSVIPRLRTVRNGVMATVNGAGDIADNLTRYYRLERAQNMVALCFFTTPEARDTNTSGNCRDTASTTTTKFDRVAHAWTSGTDIATSTADFYTDNLVVSPPGGGISPAGVWTSAVQDSGTESQRYSQIRWNSTAGDGSLTLAARASNANPPTGTFTIITAFNGSSPACPCSTGTNMSGLVGRYFQLQVNMSATATSPMLNNTQVILAGADVGTWSLNGVPYTIIAGSGVSISPASFGSGINNVALVTNNTTFMDLNLTYAAGAGLTIATTTKACYTWKNSTAFTTVTDIILIFNKPAATTGNFNTSAYLNGTLQTGNRTNASVFDYGVSESSTQVFVNTTSLNNSSTWNVLVDFVCLNATAIDASGGGPLSTFSVQQIGFGGITKSTTGGAIRFNGTELIGGGSSPATFRATATGFNFGEADLTPPLNYTFALYGTTVSALYTVLVKDSFAAVVIGASVTILDPSSGLQIFSGLTDGAGQVVAFLVPGTNYLFTVTATCCPTLVVTVKAPAASGAITLTMGTVGAGTGFVSTDVNYNLTPSSLGTGNQTIRFSAWSGTSSLILTYFNLTFNVNGSRWYFEATSSNSFLAVLSNTVNLSNATSGDTVFAFADITYRDGSFIRDIYVRQNFTIGVTFNNSTGSPPFSIRGVLSQISGSGLSGQTLILIALLVSTGITVTVATYLRPGLFGSGAIMTGMLALFSVTTPPMFPWFITVLMALFTVALYFLRRV